MLYIVNGKPFRPNPMFPSNMGLGRNIKNSYLQFLRLYAWSERSAIAHKYSYAFASNIDCASGIDLMYGE